MASSTLIDIDVLLKPISEESSVGIDIRIDTSPTSTYSMIKDARHTARAAERNSLFDGGGTDAIESWHTILTLAPQILTTEAKDIEVACWYSEALIRKAGFQGLRDGFSLIRHLIEQYWDDGLFPLADEEGMETRVAAISGLNGEGAEGVLLAPIRNTHITEDIPPGPFSLWQYKQAVDINRISDNNSRTEQAARVGFSLDDIESAIEQSSTDYLVNLRNDINDCLLEYQNISALLETRCGSQYAPPTNKIIELLEEALSAINHIAKHRFPVETEVVSSHLADEQITPDLAVLPSTGISSREDAFRQLAVISGYFRQTEPHSPISYIIDKAVNWGDMPLDQLMNELIPDPSSRTAYSSLTGVRTSDD